MDTLRIFLFSGMILHKVVWEALRKKHKPLGVTTTKKLIKLAKTLTFGFLLVQALFLDLFPIFEEPGRIRILGTLIYVTGLGMALVGRVQLGSNWLDIEDGEVSHSHSLVTKGIYRYVRHPIYAGDVLLLVGLQLALNSWLLISVLIPALVVFRQVIVEESMLSQAFPDYPAYCRRSRRFLPFIL